MEEQDRPDRFETSMQVLGKRLEVMRKKNEASFLNNKILSLESELRQMELKLEDWASHKEPRREQTPRRHLPELPRGRRAQFDMEEPPRLNLYEDSSIGSTYTPLPTLQPRTDSTKEMGNKQVTSTPNVVHTNTQTPIVVQSNIQTSGV